MKIVIEGAGEVGSHLARMLRAEANDVTVIDNDPARLSALANSSDVETLNGNPTSLKVLRDAGVSKADLFIAVYPFSTQEMNIVGALLAKRLGAGKVVARINDADFFSAENKLLFKEMGIDLLLYPEKSAADEIVGFLKHSSTEETLEFARGRLQIDVFKLDEDSRMLDLKMAEFIAGVNPEDLKEFRVIAISRQGKSIIPKLDTKFLFGDLVFTISTRRGTESLYGLFGKSNIAIRRAIIIGGGSIAEMLARSLNEQDVDVKIIEPDKDICIGLSERLPDSVSIVNGDGRNSDVLYEEGINDYDAFIALTGSDETNVLACVAARKFGVMRTVAEVENMEYLRLAEEMGVDNIINKKLVTAARIFKFTLSEHARFVHYLVGTSAEVVEYTAAPGSAITKGALKDIDFPENAIIGGVVRGSEAFIAVGDTVIEAYDRVAIFTLPESVKSVDKLFK